MSFSEMDATQSTNDRTVTAWEKVWDKDLTDEFAEALENRRHHLVSDSEKGTPAASESASTGEQSDAILNDSVAAIELGEQSETTAMEIRQLNDEAGL